MLTSLNASVSLTTLNLCLFDFYKIAVNETRLAWLIVTREHTVVTASLWHCLLSVTHISGVTVHLIFRHTLSVIL